MTVVRDLLGPCGRASDRPLAARRVHALLWIGLLLVYLSSSFTSDIPGRAPTQRNWVYGRLSGEHTYGQTFVVERDELVAVRVLLLASPGAGNESVTLRLSYAGSALPALAVVTMPLGALARHEMTSFLFPPLTLRFPPSEVTTTLRIDLEAPNLAPADWVAVMAGPNTYPNGELFVDGGARPGVDLAFQPVYRRRWFDFLLPITRMAHGKPGLLGWPPLYALLAYVYCLALARTLVWLWRAVSRSVDAH
jgi:hypothetical protein